MRGPIGSIFGDLDEIEAAIDLFPPRPWNPLKTLGKHLNELDGFDSFAPYRRWGLRACSGWEGDGCMAESTDSIRMLPRSERPRERLYRKGPSALADRELIAILLGSGSKGKSALTLASDLLVNLGNLRALALSDPTVLLGQVGVGPGKAARLFAAVELGRRVVSYRNGERFTIRGPEDVATLLMDEMRSLDREEFRVLLLDAKNRVIDAVTVSVGTLTASLIHPREGLKTAIIRSAASVILVHNHPTGIPTPSREDVEVTERFVDAGRIVGIEILDHVIIGDGRFESLRETGYF